MSVFHEGPDVPLAHVTLDGDKPLVSFPGDLPRADDFFYPGEIREGDFDARRRHKDLADRLGRRSGFPGYNGREYQSVDSLKKLAGLSSPHGGPDDLLNILDIDPIAGKCPAIYRIRSWGVPVI